MSSPAVADIEVVDGPRRVGSELRWQVRLADGSPGVLAQLLPELARDESIRRRYVRDVERVRTLDVSGLAPVVAVGPAPDPRDPRADPPYRVRVDPPGRRLEDVLESQAPMPVTEACELVAKLADIVHALHGHGAVVRDLNPRLIVVADDGQVWLTDVGLARVEVLSTRTAASLILEGSPYASPEQLTRTLVDQRSDLYGLGVILFRALTGALPFGDEPALLRADNARVVGPAELRDDVPAAIDDVVRRCLDARPERRPESARELADALRGRGGTGSAALARVQCQACSAPLRPGQRLCHNCGKLGVQFTLAPPGEGRSVVLRKVKEDAEYLANLRQFLESVADGPVPPLNFLTGDARMYSKEERGRLIRLPAHVMSGLTIESAQRVHGRLAELGIETSLRKDPKDGGPMRSARIMAAVTAALVAVFLGAAAVSATSALVVVAVTIGVAGMIAAMRMAKRKRAVRPALARPRPTPAALPASDDLVRRLADLLDEQTKPDVREQVGELALLVQELVDHRMRNAAEGAEIDAVTEPVEKLVDLVARQVETVRRVDADLARLDEGKMVRSLAAAEARREPEATRHELLDGLDRLRILEDERAAAFHRLLEASALLRRSVNLGLSVHDPEQEHEHQVALALAALGPAES